MKLKEKQDLHKQTTVQLQKKLQELQDQLTKTALEKRAGKLANTSLVKTLADNVARVKTILGEQQKA